MNAKQQRNIKSESKQQHNIKSEYTQTDTFAEMDFCLTAGAVVAISTVAARQSMSRTS